MIDVKANAWHLIMADLCLILFLTATAGMSVIDQKKPAAKQSKPETSEPKAEGELQIPPTSVQAIYRSNSDTSLAEWLSLQQKDTRLQMTIFARYAKGERQAVWDEARVLMMQAQKGGFSPRVELGPAAQTDVYVVLAYDNVFHSSLAQEPVG